MRETLNNYYDILQYIGNYPYKEVFKMIVLSFINNIENNGVMSSLPTEDRDKLYWLTSCIAGSACIFPSKCGNGCIAVFE